MLSNVTNHIFAKRTQRPHSYFLSCRLSLKKLLQLLSFYFLLFFITFFLMYICSSFLSLFLWRWMLRNSVLCFSKLILEITGNLALSSLCLSGQPCITHPWSLVKHLRILLCQGFSRPNSAKFGKFIIKIATPKGSFYQVYSHIYMVS